MGVIIRKTLCFVTSDPLTVQAFLRVHITKLSENFKVVVVMNGSKDSISKFSDIDLEFYNLRLVRRPHPYHDLVALLKLFKFFVSKRPDAVHTLTPKAGLIGMLAAKLAVIPMRTHCFTGQVWSTKIGVTRFLLIIIDKLIALLASHVLVDSGGQKSFLENNFILKKGGSLVLGAGSVSGVDVQKFSPCSETYVNLRKLYGIKPDEIVLLFVGRVCRDKGVLDLLNACENLVFDDNLTSFKLWIVGPIESLDVVEYANRLVDHGVVEFLNYSDQPQCFYQASNLFCLPSHREGFGTSIIEAAACGVPSLVSQIYGLEDAVIDGVTGWKHTVANPKDIASKIRFIIAHPEEMKSRGEKARLRTLKNFDQRYVSSLLAEFYIQNLYGTRI